MLPVEDVTSLALLYHLNSEPWANEEATADSQYEVQYKAYPEALAAIPLPKPVGTSSLLASLQKRYSCRNYLNQIMPLETLAGVLAGAYAITQLKLLPSGQSYFARSAPSAGGLYPLELYLVIQQVDQLADGIYHYNLRSHALEALASGNHIAELQAHLLNQVAISQANVVFILSAVFSRTLTKYGARGYRYILFEAGHVAQNICLLAAEHKLGSICLGGFFDTRLNAFLGLDGSSEGAVYCVGIGYPAE
jgi:SagB-type dehydrogenase family enzyme